MNSKATRETMKEEAFLVRRIITLDEVHMDNGGIRWNVRVADEGKKPFISRWFNGPTQASDFYEGFKRDEVSLD